MAKIQLNGKKITVKSKVTIYDILKKFKLYNKKVAIEYNGVIIPKVHYKKKFLKNSDNYEGVFLGTAHPAKFADIIEPIINNKIKIPNNLQESINKEKNATLLNNDYSDFSDYLLSNFR